MESYIVSAFLKLLICGNEAAARTEGGPNATDRSSTSAAVVGGCAKVTQFLVGLNLLGRGGESCGCVVSIHEEYITVPVEREDTQHQYGWSL